MQASHPFYQISRDEQSFTSVFVFISVVSMQLAAISFEHILKVVYHIPVILLQM